MDAKVFLRSAFNYDRDVVSLENGIAMDPDEGVAKQSFKDECDINNIVAKFLKTGQLPENVRMPQSGDFTGITDFQTAMNMVIEAQDAFMAFPAEVRARFANDPQRMMDFLGDENNREEAIKLGLVEKPAEKTRDVVQAVDELAAKMAGGTPKP